MLNQKVLLILGEGFHLVWIHHVMGKVPENAHKIGVVVVDIIPLWNLQYVVSVPVGVLVRGAYRHGRHLNLRGYIILNHLAVVVIKHLMTAYFCNEDWYAVDQC